MRGARGGWAAMMGMLAAAALPAAAQTVTLEPSAAVNCLTPAADQRGGPTFPFDAWKLGHKGRVLVELSFSQPDRQPAMKVLESEGPEDSKPTFVESVREHVASYRVPCLKAGASARLQLEFLFRPELRAVQASGPTDPDDARRAEMLECVQHISGQRAPDYPASAQRDEIQGRVLARLHFSAKDQPPQAQVLARPAARPLAKAIEIFTAGYRMPCFDGGEPITAAYTFTFRLTGAGAGPAGLKPLLLLEFMPHVRGVRQQTLKFDTTAMGCPFDLKFQYLQPHMNNVVAEVENSNHARRPLIAWLAQAHLNLPSSSLDTVFGDHTVITVPCLKIDLKPKETS